MSWTFSVDGKHGDLLGSQRCNLMLKGVFLLSLPFLTMPSIFKLFRRCFFISIFSYFLFPLHKVGLSSLCFCGLFVFVVWELHHSSFLFRTYLWLSLMSYKGTIHSIGKSFFIPQKGFYWINLEMCRFVQLSDALQASWAKTSERKHIIFSLPWKESTVL